jgi:hypothetical protein
MEESYDEFVKAAVEEFGDDVFILGDLNIPQEQIDQINKDKDCNLTTQDFIDLGKKVLLKEPKCPRCGHDLGGIFGSFNWGIIHGVGYCTECETSPMFRWYHYVGDLKEPIKFWELVGF